jgi:hypothetical protein
MHTAEPFVPEPSALGLEVAIGKLKSYNSPDVYQFPAELIQAGGGSIAFEINKLIKLTRKKKNCLTSGKGQSWYLFTKG